MLASAGPNTLARRALPAALRALSSSPARSASTPSSPSLAEASSTKVSLSSVPADGLTLHDFIAAPPEPSSSRIQLGNTSAPRLPPWLKTPIPTSASYNAIKRDLRGLKLATVCEEARCPNIGQCWGGPKGEATATIMLMGDTCTRGCRFCSVKTSRTPGPLDPLEPEHTAEAIARWGVGYIVITSVDRDDIPDGGADHLARCIELTKARSPHIHLECLAPDFALPASSPEQGHTQESAVARLANSGLSVYAHNLETVRGLTPHVRDRRAGYDSSLRALRLAKSTTLAANGGRWGRAGILTKSSLMLGLGEKEDEVLQAFADLRGAGCDILTLGQYVRPTKRHLKIVEYLTPERFEWYAEKARAMGFLHVASGPLVRSSFKAGEVMRGAVGRRLEEMSVDGKAAVDP